MKAKKVVIAIAVAAALLAAVVIILPAFVPSTLHVRFKAVSDLQAYFNAQSTFHRRDWDGDGVREYVADLDRLHQFLDADGNLQKAQLIERELAEADDDPIVAERTDLKHGVPKAGYLFHDLKGCIKDGKKIDFGPDWGNADGYVDGCALLAYPVKPRGFSPLFVITIYAGTVYYSRKRIDKPFDYYPDVEAPGSGWKIYGRSCEVRLRHWEKLPRLLPLILYAWLVILFVAAVAYYIIRGRKAPAGQATEAPSDTDSKEKGTRND